MALQTVSKNYEFRRVYSRGRSTSTSRIVLYSLRRRPQRPKPGKMPPTTTGARFGITVAGKLGNSVTRNKLRRRLKEICRLNLLRFAEDCDYVIVARATAVEATYSDLQRDILYLLRKQSMSNPAKTGGK